MPDRPIPSVVDRLDVLLVGEDLEHGGVQSYIVGLANRLVDEGHVVAVQAIDGGPLWSRLDPRCDRLRVRRSNRILEAIVRARQIRGRARSHPGLVVHGHQRIESLIARMSLAGRRGIPVVEHVHNVFASRGPVRWLSFRSDLLIACGTRVASMLEGPFRRRPAVIRTVLNGVAPASAEYLRSHEDVAPFRDEIHVLGVGRLSEQKDPVRFVHVIAAMVRAAPDVRIHVDWVGDGPLRDRFHETIARSGLESVIDHVGQVADPSPYFERADVLLMTSGWEGLPLVALESLAHGRGVVLPDVGSCVDAAAGGDVGAIYEAGLDSAAIADIVIHAAVSGDLARWSRRAMDVHQRLFTYDRMVAEVEAAYRAVRLRPRGA